MRRRGCGACRERGADARSAATVPRGFGAQGQRRGRSGPGGGPGASRERRAEAGPAAPRKAWGACAGRKFQTGAASQRRRLPLGATPGRVRISVCGRAGGSGSIRSLVLRALASRGRPSSVVVKRRSPQGGALAARVPPLPRGKAAGRRRPGPVWLRGLGGLALPLKADTQGRVTGAGSEAARSEDWLALLTSLKAEGRLRTAAPAEAAGYLRICGRGNPCLRASTEEPLFLSPLLRGPGVRPGPA